MTQDQIIEWAKEAGLMFHIPFPSDSHVAVALHRFADHAAKQEREACALVCDEQVQRSLAAAEKAKSSRDQGIYRNAAQTSIWNAAAIRARGDKSEPPHGWSAERHAQYMKDVAAAGGKK